MNRTERVEANAAWDVAFDAELAGARRRALVRAVRSHQQPTMGHLLRLIGPDRCDLEDTPSAGEVRVGDMVAGRDGEGPMVLHVIKSLGLALSDPFTDAKRLGRVEVDKPLEDLLD